MTIKQLEELSKILDKRSTMMLLGILEALSIILVSNLPATYLS